MSEIMALLDEGLLIYRRHMLALLIITGVGIVPFGASIALLGLLAAVRGNDDGSILLTMLLALILAPLTLWACAGLSHAARLALDGQPVRAGAALRIHPLRLAGMGCFGLVYGFVVQLLVSVVTMGLLCVCVVVASFAGGMSAYTASAFNSPALSASLVAVAILAFIAVYGTSLALGAGTGASLIYSIQAFVQEQRSFGATIACSLELVGYRFGHNLLAWIISGLISAALGLVITLAMGMLLPLPVGLIFGPEATVTLTVTSLAWAIGLALALPPLPIWMALLYAHNQRRREAPDLAERVAQRYTLRYNPPDVV